MHKSPPKEIENLLNQIAKLNNWGEIRIITPRVCDLCLDDDKEAHVYGLEARGQHWQHLCNECYQLLEDELKGKLETLSHESLVKIVHYLWAILDEIDQLNSSIKRDLEFRNLTARAIIKRNHALKREGGSLYVSNRPDSAENGS